MSTSSFKEKEERLNELREQLQAKKIPPDIFNQEVQKLSVVFNGEEWRLGVAGQWTRKQGETWVLAVPPVVETFSNEHTDTGGDQKWADEGAETLSSPGIPPMGAATPGSKDPAGVATQKQSRKPDTQKWAAKWLILGGVTIVLLIVCGFGASFFFNATTSSTPTAIIQTVSMSMSANAEVSQSSTSATSPTASPTPSSIPTNTPTASQTPVPLPTSTPTSTFTHTSQPTGTSPAPTPTSTLTLTPLPSPSPTAFTLPTSTPAPQETPTSTPFIQTGLIAYPAFNTTTQTYDTYIRRLETGEVIRTIENASQPDISSDGKQIVYRSWQPDQRGLFVENLDGSGNVWSPSQKLLFQAARPRWKYDGDIVFAANNISPEQWGIFYSGDRSGPNNGRTPAWFNDGRLVYQGSVGVQAGLIMIDHNSSDPRFMTHSPQDTAPSPSPDNSKIVFMSDREGTWDLYLLDIASQDIKRLTNDLVLDASPIWSPNGQHIAFVSNRDGAWAIWIIKPDGTSLEKLLALPGSFDGTIEKVPKAEQTGWQAEHISWVK